MEGRLTKGEIEDYLLEELPDICADSDVSDYDVDEDSEMRLWKQCDHLDETPSLAIVRNAIPEPEGHASIHKQTNNLTDVGLEGLGRPNYVAHQEANYSLDIGSGPSQSHKDTTVNNNFDDIFNTLLDDIGEDQSLAIENENETVAEREKEDDVTSLPISSQVKPKHTKIKKPKQKHEKEAKKKPLKCKNKVSKEKSAMTKPTKKNKNEPDRHWKKKSLETTIPPYNYSEGKKNIVLQNS